MQQESTCNSKKSDIVISKQASMIKRLKNKVSSAELSVEFMQNQLQNEQGKLNSQIVHLRGRMTSEGGWGEEGRWCQGVETRRYNNRGKRVLCCSAHLRNMRTMREDKDIEEDEDKGQ